MIKRIVLAAMMFSTAAFAADGPPIDFSQKIMDPRGMPMTLCDASIPGAPDACKLPLVLADVAYSALSAPPAQREQSVDPKNAALGWKIYMATAPLALDTDEKVRLKKAFLTNVKPMIGYAACRMIVDPSECDKL
jgi:hypothetical protein